MVLYYYHLTHNLKVAGSNPAPATNLFKYINSLAAMVFQNAQRIMATLLFSYRWPCVLLFMFFASLRLCRIDHANYPQVKLATPIKITFSKTAKIYS